MAARLVVVVVVVVLVACVGSVLTAAVSSTGQGDKNSFDTWTREDPWNEVVDKIMKEEFPLGGTDGREGVNPRGKLRAWSKTQMFLESMTRISSPTADRDKQVTEKLVLSWARKWNDMEGKFLASEGSFSKTIKLGPIKNCSKPGDLIIITVPPTVSPNPVHVGTNVSLKFAATLKEPVEGGQIMATVTTNGFNIFSETVDICSLLLQAHMKCPVQGTFSFENNPLQFVVPPEVSYIPSGPYSVKAVANDDKGQELVCLQMDLTVQ